MTPRDFRNIHTTGNSCRDHCVKSVQIQSYFWSVFSCIQTVNLHIQYKFRKIRTRNNSIFGHFSCSGCTSMCEHVTKTTLVFFMLMEKPLGHYFQVWSPYYLPAKCNQKTPLPVSSRWQIKSEKAKKG